MTAGNENCLLTNHWSGSSNFSKLIDILFAAACVLCFWLFLDSFLSVISVRFVCF